MSRWLPRAADHLCAHIGDHAQTLLAGAVLVAAPAEAATVIEDFAGVTHTADSSNRGAGATATDYDGSHGSTVVIPDVIDIGCTPYDVTTIGSYAFQNNALTTATIGDHVTTIGSSAFDQNKHLATVRFLGAAPTVSPVNDEGPSFDTTSGTLVLYYNAMFGNGNGFTTPTWQGYHTAINAAAVSGLAPTITGTLREGSVLTAHPGPVNPSTATLTYQWKANGVAIKGATHSTYTLRKSEAGRRIIVTMVATSPNQTPQTATSAPTRIIASTLARLVLSTHTIHRGQTFQVTVTYLKN